MKIGSLGLPDEIDMGSIAGKAHQEQLKKSPSSQQTPEPAGGSAAQPQPSNSTPTPNPPPNSGEVPGAQHINGVPIIDLEVYTREMGVRMPGNSTGNIGASEPRNSPRLQDGRDASNSAGGRPQPNRSVFGPEISTPPRSTRQPSNDPPQPNSLRDARGARRDRRESRGTLENDLNIPEHHTRRPHTDPSMRNMAPTAGQDSRGALPASRVHCRLNEIAAATSRGDGQSSSSAHRRRSDRRGDVSTSVSVGNEATIANPKPSRPLPAPSVPQIQLCRMQPLIQPATIQLAGTLPRGARGWLIPGANDPEPSITPQINEVDRLASTMQASRGDIAAKRGRSPESNQPSNGGPAPVQQQPPRKKRSTLKDAYVENAERSAPEDRQSQVGTQGQRASISAPVTRGLSTQGSSSRPRNTFARDIPSPNRPNQDPPVIPRVDNPQQTDHPTLRATQGSTVSSSAPGRNPPRRPQPVSVTQPPPTYAEPAYPSARQDERLALPSNYHRSFVAPGIFGPLRSDQQLDAVPQVQEGWPSDAGEPRRSFGPPSLRRTDIGNLRFEERLLVSLAWDSFLIRVREQQTLVQIGGQLYNGHQQPLHQDDARRIVRIAWIDSILYIINNRRFIALAENTVTQGAARLIDTPPLMLLSPDGGRLEVHAPPYGGMLEREPHALQIIIHNSHALRGYSQSREHFPRHHASGNPVPYNCDSEYYTGNMPHQLPRYFVPQVNEGYTNSGIAPRHPVPYRYSTLGRHTQQPGGIHVPDTLLRRPPPPARVRPTYIDDRQAQQVALDRLTALALEFVDTGDANRNENRTPAGLGALEAGEATIAYHTALKKELRALIDSKQFEAARRFVRNIPDIGQVFYDVHDDGLLNLLCHHDLFVRGGPATNRNSERRPVEQASVVNIAPTNIASYGQHQNLHDGNIGPRGEQNNRRPANNGDEAPTPRPFEDNPNWYEGNGESLHPSKNVHKY